MAQALTDADMQALESKGAAVLTDADMAALDAQQSQKPPSVWDRAKDIYSSLTNLYPNGALVNGERVPVTDLDANAIYPVPAPERLADTLTLLSEGGGKEAAKSLLKGGGKAIAGAKMMFGHPLAGGSLILNSADDLKDAASIVWNAFKATGGNTFEDFEQWLNRPHPLEVPKNPLEVNRPPQPLAPSGPGVIDYRPLTEQAQQGPHPLINPANPLEVQRPPQPLAQSGSGVIDYGPITSSAPVASEIPAGISKEDWEKLPKALQNALRESANKAAAAKVPAPDVSIDIAPAHATPASAVAPQEFSTASPLDTSKVETKDPFAELTRQIDEKIATGKEVEASIPSEEGQLSQRQMDNRKAVADKGAKYLANQGLTTGRIEAMRQTNPEMYQSLRDEVGGAKNISKQKNYSPSDDTWDMMMERLAALEGKGKIATVVQPPSPVKIDPVILAQFKGNAKAAARALKLQQAMQSSQ